MQFTNKLNLPLPLFNALITDEYDPGVGDYTPSSLSRPAYMIELEKLHRENMVIEASDRVWSLFGKATHHIMESGSKNIPNNFSEERIYCRIGKWVISMQFDNLYVDVDGGILDDYKTTSVYKFKPNYDGTLPSAPDWEAQLNIGAYILRHDWLRAENNVLIPGPGPVDVKNIRIVGILKDHKQSEARYNKNYPQHPISVRSFELWSDEKVEGYVHEKASERDAAALTSINGIYPCNDEEMWATPDKYALMKKGVKRAVKLYETDSSATGAMTDPKHYVERRPGDRKRCVGYCDVGKNGLCPSFNEFKKHQIEE